MTLTLAQARAVTLDHLDDNDSEDPNARWSNAQVDVGLALALSSCLSDYVSEGGDRFDLELSASTTSGALDMSSYSPLYIRGMTMLYGNRYWPLEALRAEDRGIQDADTKSLQVRYVREYALPTTTTHPLVGVGATAANSWDAFDHWICIRAAIHCSIKDDDLRATLTTQEEAIRTTVLLRPKLPSAVAFPKPTSYYSRSYGYFWQPSTKVVQICRRGGW